MAPVRPALDRFSEVYRNIMGIRVWYWEPMRDTFHFELESGATGRLSGSEIWRLDHLDQAIAQTMHRAVGRAVAVAEYAYEFETYEVHD